MHGDLHYPYRNKRRKNESSTGHTERWNPGDDVHDRHEPLV
jgi:hypothetical protein